MFWETAPAAAAAAILEANCEMLLVSLAGRVMVNYRELTPITDR